jgi:CelD/BcsL family acetyltransferase involved in cellulose biosynthesis
LPRLLFRLPSTSPTIAAIRERVPLLLQRDAGSCPVIEIDDDPEAALSKRHRQDLRRAGRRAAAFGDVSVEVHEPTPGDVDELLDVALQIEARSWKGRAGTALAVDQRRERFYRAYCAHAAESAILRVAFLRLGDEPAAMQIAVERAGALWLLKIGYDERFSTASPGQLLMLETLRWAADRGLERYEFLGAARDWTRAWTRTEWSCTTVMAYPANPRGAAALAVDGARWARARIRS